MNEEDTNILPHNYYDLKNKNLKQVKIYILIYMTNIQIYIMMYIIKNLIMKLIF